MDLRGPKELWKAVKLELEEFCASFHSLLLSPCISMLGVIISSEEDTGRL